MYVNLLNNRAFGFLKPKKKGGTMKGQILDYSIQLNSGTISGADGKRYQFTGSEWKGTGMPMRGITVDFDVEG